MLLLSPTVKLFAITFSKVSRLSKYGICIKKNCGDNKKMPDFLIAGKYS